MAKNQNMSNEDKEYYLRLSHDIQEASKSLEAYFKVKKDILDINNNIASINQTNVELGEEILDLEEKIKLAKGDEEKRLKGELKGKKQALKKSTKLVELAKEELEFKQQVLKNSTKMLNIGKAIVDQGKSLVNIAKQQVKWGFEQQKSIKQTELSMGILSNQAEAFRGNIYKTALKTQAIGISSKELAKIQGTYSENVGRSVVLSQEQLEAVSHLAKGTILGAEGAAEFAANMEIFGISAKGSAKIVQSMLESSHKMGLDSSKIIKTVRNNMKLANKYHFKGGIAGLTKMAALTTKFKMEMGDIAGFAEKLFTPEGAIEAAAQLQVLGGGWAKLGDPFELMFRARNDITGLTEDIIEATSATARWDETTKEFKIDPMELHRLREVANATGLDFDNLANSARQAAKFTKIKTDIRGNFTSEDKEYISSLAQLNDGTGKFQFTFLKEDGTTVTKNINDLGGITSGMISEMRDQKQTLEENALQALTFDESWQNLVDTFKTTLLPGFQLFTNSLQEGLTSFTKWAGEKDVFGSLAEFGRQVGEWGGWVVKLIAENPWKAAGAILIGKMTMWYARGVQLGLGFNTVASRGGGAGGAGGGGKKLPPVRNPKTGRMMPNPKNGAAGGGFGKYAKGGAGVLAGGFAGYNEYQENKANEMDSGENWTRTAMTGGGAGLGAWGGAAAGAALGSMVPVIGTIIGGLIGAGLGAWGGEAIGDKAGDMVFDDFISRPGENAVSINPKDTLIGAKSGGPIDKMMDASTQNTTTSGKMDVGFSQPLKIEGKIELNSDGNSNSIDLDDPILMSNLSRVIQEHLSKAIGGGKIGSNPILI